MTWRDRYRPASFRGVPFRVEASDLTTGRRGTDHVYPGREIPYAEDSGRQAERIHVTGYVIGPDYDVDRDALLAALREEGPGTLVHPYLGTLRVVARSATLRESTAQGGFAVFELDFVEAGANLAPVSATDSAGALAEAAAVAEGEIEESFADRFLADFPSWVTDSAIAVVEETAAVLEDALAPITAAAEGADDFRRGILELRGEAASLVLEPILLARRIRGLVQQFRALPESELDRMRNLLDLAVAPFDFEPIEETTASRARQRRNRDAIAATLRRSALFEATAALPGVSFASRGEVVSAREAFEAAFEAETLAAGDDPDQDADLRQLERMFAGAMRDLSLRDNGTLARLREILLPASQPAIVVAHRLYQDATRDQEIVDRNRVTHPLFVPGGVPLQVLTSG